MVPESTFCFTSWNLTFNVNLVADKNKHKHKTGLLVTECIIHTCINVLVYYTYYGLFLHILLALVTLSGFAALPLKCYVNSQVQGNLLFVLCYTIMNIMVTGTECC